MFSLRLKELRENAGYSQYSFAEAFHVSQSTVGGWESGSREPRDIKTLKKIADFFGVTVDYLISDDNDSQEKKPADEDGELMEYLEELKHNPGMRMLFKATKGATKEDFEKAVKMIEIMRDTGGADGA